MQRRTCTFRFNDLSTELALHIILFAAEPTVQNPFPNNGRQNYANTLPLTRVSRAFYYATMPHLLSAVILNNDEQLALFVRAVQMQKKRRHTSSRLGLDYSNYVRRMWISDCLGPLANSEDQVNYNVLSDLVRTADVGLGTDSIEILSSILAPHGRKPGNWPARKQLSLAGPFLRWNPLISTCEGQAFLSNVTHLILWDGSKSEENMLKCLKTIPFAHLSNLSHLAVSLTSDRMLVFAGKTGTPMPKTIQKWCKSQDPVAHGVIVPFHVGLERHWGGVYARGDYNVIWNTATKLIGH